jgi:hypothetical protein
LVWVGVGVGLFVGYVEVKYRFILQCGERKRETFQPLLIYYSKSDTTSKDATGGDRQQSDKEMEGSDVTKTDILYAMQLMTPECYRS